MIFTPSNTPAQEKLQYNRGSGLDATKSTPNAQFFLGTQTPEQSLTCTQGGNLQLQHLSHPSTIPEELNNNDVGVLENDIAPLGCGVKDGNWHSVRTLSPLY